MILSEKVVVKINPSNYGYYKKIIGNIKTNEYYEIDVLDLNPTTHQKIEVKCDICECVSMKPYREYLKSFNNRKIYCCSPKCAIFKNKETNLDRYGYENTFQVEEFKNKIINSNLEKYGVEYPSQSYKIREKSKSKSLFNYGVDWASKSEIVQQKMQKTCLEKFGTNRYASSEIAKIKRINDGQQIPDDKKTKFEIYQKEVRKITNKIKNKLFEDWDGKDYYDNEYIINNLKLNHYDKKYPTIDHKISIYYGFINNIDPKIIGDLENLCITKRSINSSKSTKCF